MRESYRPVLVVLIITAIAGSLGALAMLIYLDNPLLPDVAVALALAGGCLYGVERSHHPRPEPESTSVADEPTAAGPAPDLVTRLRRWMTRSRNLDALPTGIAAAGILGLALVLTRDTRYFPLTLVEALAGAAVCAGGAALAATAVRYLRDLDPRQFPESAALARAGRVLAWMLGVAALSMLLLWLNLLTAVRVLHGIAVLTVFAVCFGLMRADTRAADRPRRFPVDLSVFSVLGARANIVASLLDSAERQLGIDVRSTWALAVIRQSVEPLAIALCVLGWLTTSLTIVGIDEQGLVERLGVPVLGAPLTPGLHLHWPWPIDRVLRLPVLRVQVLNVGHEGEERGGPEDVLWARQHAENEYTLLLGNGRDLITVDASVQYRIADVRAWHYHSQNPAEALKAIAYRAVMRTTVNRTLTDALSENLVTTTATMRAMVQQDADALSLGIEVLDFTVGGMHPPVPVAQAYQAVVSAELGKRTAVVNAQMFRNQTVPAAETEATGRLNSARADGSTMAAQATGEASSFLTLQSQYRAAPEDYAFRRRLETLEQALAGRRFTIVDARIQRDGGELWVRP